MSQEMQNVLQFDYYILIQLVIHQMYTNTNKIIPWLKSRPNLLTISYISDSLFLFNILTLLLINFQ